MISFKILFSLFAAILLFSHYSSGEKSEDEITFVRHTITPGCLRELVEYEGRPININLDPLLTINDGSFSGRGVAADLSLLQTDVSFSILTQVVKFNLSLPKVHIVGESYSATGAIVAEPFSHETIYSGHFEGSGPYDISAKGIQFEGKAELNVDLGNNRVSIKNLRINELKFHSPSINLGNYFVAGIRVDWDWWSRNLVHYFELDWTTKKHGITELVRITANQKLKDYTLKEIIDLLQKDNRCGATKLQPQFEGML